MRQKRRFLLNQLVGFMMIGTALTMAVRPMSAVLDQNLLLIFAVWLFVFGWALAFFQHSGHLAFFLLTLPIFAISAAYGLYVNAHENASAIPAFLMSCFYWTLQYCHARQEEFRQWMKV